VKAEPVLYRDEALGLVFAVHDILEEVRRIRALLEDDDGEEEAEVDVEE
jgi:hypothetical protein